MARGQRRSTRTAHRKSASPLSSSPLTPTDAAENGSVHDRGDACPACSESSTPITVDKELWVRCDYCKNWYHWRCVGNGEDMDTIDKWYCAACMKADPARVITIRAPARKSNRKRTQRDYANLHSGLASDPARWTRMLEGKNIKDNCFRRMEGSAVNISWLEQDDNAMKEPIIIENPDGLGMKMPPEDFTVADVAELVGKDTPIEVIDVASQSTSPGWTLGKWVDYFTLEPSQRDKILNVISLEISGTKLSDIILPPRIVRELDWVENYWPSTRKGKGNAYPKVQLYCLMGVAKAWTDWHIDFAGSSVYYHILRGSKVFYFIKPTPENLAAYEKWSGTELQSNTWLGDMVDEVYKVELTQGNTMIIPTGWIHAVHTPVDTLVFGGNFVHSYDIATQLRVRNIEIATQVPKKFRFPMFSKLCWYVGDRYLRDLKSHSGASFSPRVLSSVLALAKFLVSEAHALERGSEQAKKEVRDQIPADRIKDAPAMARELLWRAKLVADDSSEDETQGKTRTSSNQIIGNKRRRIDSESPDADEHALRFRNFKPKVWQNMVSTSRTEDSRVVKALKPANNDSWTENWIDDSRKEEDDGDEVEVHTRREVVVRVRRTAQGLERQRIERVVEDWVWKD